MKKLKKLITFLVVLSLAFQLFQTDVLNIKTNAHAQDYSNFLAQQNSQNATNSVSSQLDVSSNDNKYTVKVLSEDTEAPTAPSSLSYAAVTQNSVSLSWDASTDNTAVTGYNVYNGQTLVESSSTTTYTVTNLSCSTEYVFSVKAYDEAGNTSVSSAELIITTGPAVPTNLTGVPTSTTIAVSWGTVTGALAYDLQIDTTLISDINENSYTQTGLNAGQTYPIKVRSKTASIESEWSNTIQVTTGTGTTVSGTISSNTTWTAANSPYKVTSSITIPSGVNLTIQAGTIVKFSAGCGITVNGTLNITGSSSSPVVLTASGDPLCGGTSPSNWGGIIVNSAGTVNIDYAKIRYAGLTNNYAIKCSGNVSVTNSELTKTTPASCCFYLYNSSGSAVIKNNIISDTTNGIYIYNSNFANIEIEGNTISNVSIGIYYNSNSAVMDIEGNTISSSGYGLNIVKYTSGALTIQNNAISSSTSYSAYINLSAFTPTSLTGINNNTLTNKLVFHNCTIPASMSLPITTFELEDTLTIPSGMTLTIPAGTIIKLRASYGIIVKGTLNVTGSSSVPVVFTSSGDPQYGGTSASYWGGFTVNSTGIANIDYAKILYAGPATIGYAFNNSGNLNVTNSEITKGASSSYVFYLSNSVSSSVIKNNKIADAKYGIFNCNSSSGSANIEGNSISNVTYGIYSYYNSATIKYNTFSGCTSYAIDNLYPSTFTIDASYNYWNSVNGPSIYVKNPQTNTWYWTSAGEKITSGVSYIPYYGNDLNIQHHYGENNAPSGSFCRQYTDMSMSNSIQTFSVTRTYNSLDDRDSSLFGRGWTFGFEGSVSDYSIKMTDGNGVVTTQTIPTLKIVRLMNGSVCSFIVNGDGTYTANDSHNTLTLLNGNYILTTNEQTKYHFNSSGKLCGIVDKNGNTTTINFDTSDKIASIVDCTGRTYSVEYNGNHIVSIQDVQTSRTVSYVYSVDNLTQVIDPIGSSTYYTYDTAGYLSGVYDNNNTLIDAISYNHTSGDNQNKVSTTTDVYGQILTYSYDLTNSIVTIADSNGRQTLQYYDSSLNVIKEVDAEGKTTIMTYPAGDKYGEASSVIDRNGNTTSFTRDSNGNITTITNPDLSTKVMTYDSKNNVTSLKDENNKYTFFVYDANGNLADKAQPLNGTDIYTGSNLGFVVTHYTYNSTSTGGALNGLVASVTDPEGNVSEYTYDSYGNMESSTNALGKTTIFSYNSDGWLLQQTSPLGNVTNYTYDSNGRQFKKVLDGGETYRTVYDLSGRTTKEVSPNQYVSGDDSVSSYSGDVGTRYTYYSSGKIHTRTNAEGNTIAYTYDIYGNTLSETLPSGAMYRYTYDSMNRLTGKYYKETASGSEVLLETYTYSISNKNTQKTMKVYTDSTHYTSEVLTFDYAGREISKLNADGTLISTSYNANGTINTTTDAAGKTTYYAYDGLNRQTDKWTPFSDGLYTYIGKAYNKNGQTTQGKSGVNVVALNSYPSQLLTISYAYNADATVASQIDSEGRTVNFYYDGDGVISGTQEYASSAIYTTAEYINNYLGKPVSKTVYVRRGDLNGNDYTDNSDCGLVTSYTYDKDGNLLTETAPNGVVTTFTYDFLDRQTSASSPGVDENGTSAVIAMSQTYDWNGNVLQKTDAKGNITQYTYDSRGNLLKETNAKGDITAYYYDLADRLIAVVSPNGYFVNETMSNMNRTEYEYDFMGRIITVTQNYYDTNTSQRVSFVEKAYQYDSNGNTLKELNATGYAAGSGSTVSQKISTGYGVEHTYNFAGLVLTDLNPVSKDAGLSYTAQYAYDTLGRKTSVTNAQGAITNYRYDGKGNLLSVTVQQSSSATAKTVKTCTYDYLGNILSQTDGNGNTTTFEYNAFRKISKAIYPGDSTITANTQCYQYDRVGNLIKKWDSTDLVIQYTYDNHGHKLSETSGKADGTQAITLTYAYDLNGNLRFSSDGNGVQAENTYDALNSLVSSTTVGQTTTRTYDGNGNVLTSTDWLGNVNSFTYDPLNRLVKKTDPYQNVIENLSYNNSSQQTESRDSLGNVALFAYDKDNRLITTTDPEGHTTSEAYDSVGNVSRTTDADGNVTSYAYDEFNRLTGVTNALNQTSSYTYDGNGNMLAQTDGSGNVVTYEYNIANLKVKTIGDGGLTGTPGNYIYDSTKVENYTYTTNGQLASKTDENGNTTSYTYDVHRRKTSEVCGSLSIAYTYDNNGNLLTMTDGTGTTTRIYDSFNRVLSKSVPDIGTTQFAYDITANVTEGCRAETSTDPQGNITTKVYDKAGRLINVLADGKTTTYTYNSNGSTASVVYCGGASETYTYTADNQLSTLINKKADNTVIDSYSYSYDNANNILSKTDSTGTTTYTYDALNRLLSETTSAASTSYTYDASSNRATKTVVIGSDTTLSTYSYNTSNWLTGIISTFNDAVTESVAYAYDNNGNVLSETKTPYQDGDPQTPVVALANTYDNFNQHIASVTSGGDSISNTYNGEGLRVQKSVNGAVTKYLYESGKVVAEYDSQIDQTARNIYGNNLLMRISTGTYYFMYNGHADVTALLNADTATIDGTYYYDAFGNVLSKIGSVDNSILYAGYQYDTETGLYYLNARMYDPETARFLQEDTYRGNPNDPMSLNLYTYCANNPLIYSDPSGHNWLKSAWNWTKENVIKPASETVSKIEKAAQNVDLQTVKKVAKDVAIVAGCIAITAVTFGAGAGIVLAIGAVAFTSYQAGSSYLKGEKITATGVMDNLASNTLMATAGVFACSNPVTAPAAYATMAGLGAQATITSGSQFVSAMEDPDATTGQKWAYGLDTVMAAAGTAFSSYGFAKSYSSGGYMRLNNARRTTNEAIIEETGVCFIAGTLIPVKNGFKEIQDIKAGDEVFSENPETSEKGFKKVTNVFVKETSELVHVFVGNVEIKTTPTHPFWVEGIGWVAAGELKAGDKVSLGSGDTVSIDKVDAEKLDQTIKVYNFEVEAWHTYFVSELQVLVHNSCAQPPKTIETPYENAVQATSEEALAARNYVDNGGELFRGGKFGKQNTTDAQFWATENPTTPGYSQKFGAAYDTPNYIIGGKLKPGAEYITRPAPPLGTNPGGNTEVVTNPNSVNLDFFYMP